MQEKNRGLCFEPFHKIVNDKARTVDHIYSTLDCIRFHCHQTRSKEEISSTRKVIGLVSTGSLKGIVHVIKVDKYIDSPSSSNLRRNEGISLAGPEGLWISDIFYLNNYYVDRSDMYYYYDVA